MPATSPARKARGEPSLFLPSQHSQWVEQVAVTAMMASENLGADKVASASVDDREGGRLAPDLN